MKHTVNPAGNAKTAIAELQGLKRRIITGSAVKAIAGITLTGTDPVSIESTGHGLSSRAKIGFDSLIVGTVELNGTTHRITVTDVNNFTLDGTDSSDYTAYTSGGSVLLDVNQAITDLLVGDAIHSVIGIDGDGSASVSVLDLTDVCSIQPKKLLVEGVTLTNGEVVKIVSTGHGLLTGRYIVFDESIVGTVELNGKSFMITKVDADNFTLDGTKFTTAGAEYTAYTSGGLIILKTGTLQCLQSIAAYRLLVDFFTVPVV